MGTPQDITLEQVTSLVMEGYVPFGDISRAMYWPNDVAERMESDVEHSFSLAFVGCALARELGLDAGLVAQFAIVHDLPELFTGDASVWDEKAHAAKRANEKDAIVQIGRHWPMFPWLKTTVDAYVSQQTEEARFVHALDKLLPALLAFNDDGRFWIENGITYEMHQAKRDETRPKVASHPVILALYDTLCAKIDGEHERLFFEPYSVEF